MILYGANVILDDSGKCSRNFVNERLQALNKEIDTMCKGTELLMRAVEIRKNKIDFVILIRNGRPEESTLKKQMTESVKRIVHEDMIRKVDLKEITVSRFSSLLSKYSIGLLKKDHTTVKLLELLPEGSIGFFRTDPEMWEDILKIPKKNNFRAKAKKLMADATLVEEMDRIYSENHPKQYRGVPVHYRISSDTLENAQEIATVLAQALYVNNRILSKRITHIKMGSLWGHISGNIDKILNLSSGGCVIIDMFEKPENRCGSSWGEPFNDEDEDDLDWSFWDDGDEERFDGWGGDWRPFDLVKNLTACIEKHMHETQLIFIENMDKPMYSGRLFRTLKETMHIVEIKEGFSSTQAQRHFAKLVEDAGLSEYNANPNIFEEGRYYAEAEIAKRFREFSMECMTDKIYTEYSREKMEKAEGAPEKKAPYDELQRLIGLTDVKQMVGDIIALQKVDKMRSAFKDKNTAAEKDGAENKAGVSRHMLFSGNPGTAKTTVARLMAQIMKEEALLKTGKFIECGRADLVGQYVGWTAVQVKEKFRQARGGVLFIDEAYSLVDDSNTFGDEAINTIVAEMENLRDEVVVIFAGYPDKMKGFLDRNEGLRSRIAHHIHFPDYSPQELVEILKKLAKDRDFVLGDDATGRALEIFQRACRQADYGNGRFARNLLEKAIFRQASRIASLPRDEVSRDQLFALTAEDFPQEDPVADEAAGKEMRRIGFAV